MENQNVEKEPMTRAEIYFAIKKKAQDFIAETSARDPEAGAYFAKSVVFSDNALTINFKKVPLPPKKK